MRPLRLSVVFCLALVVAVASSVALPLLAHAAAADTSLIQAALDALDHTYYKPVDTVQLLNVGIASLRKTSHLDTAALPDIPAGTVRNQALALFRSAYDKAAHAPGTDQEALATTTLREMLASLHDSHVVYFDPKAFDDFQRALKGQNQYAGVGLIIAVRKDDAGQNEVFVLEVVDGSPAAAADVKRYDRITQVDGASFDAGVTARDAANRIRGDAGTTVTLTIERAGTSRTVPIVRASISIKSVAVSLERPGVALVRIRNFAQGTADQVRQGLTGLQAKGALHGVIIDLRGNPGGLLREAENTAGIFVPQGTSLGKYLSRQGTYEQIARGNPMVPSSLPIAILTDGGTASSAEVLSIGLHDSGRATLIGEKTAGALGAGQMVPLPIGGMEITVSEVVGPHFEQIEHVGITPDRIVAISVAELQRGVDTQLDEALKLVSWVVPRRLIRAA